jgi:hypothetical protein
MRLCSAAKRTQMLDYGDASVHNHLLNFAGVKN